VFYHSNIVILLHPPARTTMLTKDKIRVRRQLLHLRLITIKSILLNDFLRM